MATPQPCLSLGPGLLLVAAALACLLAPVPAVAFMVHLGQVSVVELMVLVLPAVLALWGWLQPNQVSQAALPAALQGALQVRADLAP